MCKDSKWLVAFCRRSCRFWWWLLLVMLKKNLDVISDWSCGKKFTIQQYGARSHTANSVTNYLNENVPDYIRKENWSPNSSDLKLLDYTIWNITKKIFYKNVKRYEDTEGLSEALSYAWDKLTKFIYSSSNGWCD